MPALMWLCFQLAVLSKDLVLIQEEKALVFVGGKAMSAVSPESSSISPAAWREAYCTGCPVSF